MYNPYIENNTNVNNNYGNFFLSPLTNEINLPYNNYAPMMPSRNDFSNFNPLNQSMSNPNLGNNCELMVPSRVHLLKSSINDTNLGNIHPMVNLKH
jgi:hypothetical protein